MLNRHCIMLNILLCIGCLSFWIGVSLFTGYSAFHFHILFVCKFQITNAIQSSDQDCNWENGNFLFEKSKRISIFWIHNKEEKRQKLLLNYQSTFYQCHLSICSIAYEIRKCKAQSVCKSFAIKIDKLTNLWQDIEPTSQNLKREWKTKTQFFGGNLGNDLWLCTKWKPFHCKYIVQSWRVQCLVSKKKKNNYNYYLHARLSA